jgi:hypothetical protein
LSSKPLPTTPPTSAAASASPTASVAGSWSSTPGFGLCFQHAKLKLDRREVADLSAALLGENPNGLHTVERINDLLYNVICLLAQNRISPRRAAVLTYACSLLLGSAVILNR